MKPKKNRPVAAPAKPPQPAASRGIGESGAPLVFVSHDTRDADLAEAFSNLLTDASGGILQSFRSSDRKGTSGIEFGEEWYSAIMSKLDQATDVVALLTVHSLDRPWILYEAGVAKGKLNTTVLGVALGIPLESAYNGPFAQFQNSNDDEDSLTKLVLQLIRKNPNASPREEAVRRQVEVFIAASKQILDNRGKTPSPEPKMDETTIAKMFEEVKILVGALPERVSIRESSLDRRRRPRMHPMIFDEILHMALHRGRGRDSAVGILLAFSFFRDSQPWLYELGRQLYSALVGGDTTRARRIFRDIRQAIDFIRRTPLEREFIRSRDDDETFMVMRHLTASMDEVMSRLLAKPKRDAPDNEAKEG